LIAVVGPINFDLAARTARLPGQTFAMLADGKGANQAVRRAWVALVRAIGRDVLRPVANLSATIESNLAFQPLD